MNEPTLFGSGEPDHVAPGVPEPGTCRLCGAAIVWIRTAADKAMPCDPPMLTVVTDAGLTVRGRVSHFATCPRAGEARKPRTGTPSPDRVTRHG